MARTLYVATTNPGKLRDFAVAAAAHDIRILPLPGLASIEPPAEDAPTFEAIAREKAIYYSQFLPGEIVLADDSGLEVDALQGAPGVRSARYAADAGFHSDTTTDINNNLFHRSRILRHHLISKAPPMLRRVPCMATSNTLRTGLRAFQVNQINILQSRIPALSPTRRNGKRSEPLRLATNVAL